MTPARAAIALGSNLGDRLGFLRRGLAGLAARSGVVVTGVSAVYETAPVGGPDAQPAYLNAVALADVALGPAELLAALHEIEAAADRTREVRWGPRTLDLDLLAYGDVVVDGPALTLPHPRAHERAFVLVPWLDADPAAVLPLHGPVARLAAAVDRSGVARRPDLALEVPA